MASALIKFYNSDYLIYDSRDKISKAVRQDETPYTIRSQINKLMILENQNSILCTLLYNSCYYEMSEDQKVFQVYSNTYTKVKDIEKKSQYLIIEMKILNEDHTRWLKEQVFYDTTQHYQFRQQITFQKYKGPLSYEPVRSNRVSLLSTESPEQNYRGIINLGLLILIGSHIRLIVENFLKYGFLLKNMSFDLGSSNNEHPYVKAISFIICNLMIAFLIQKLQFTQKIHTKIIIFLNIINISSLLVIPSYFIQQQNPATNIAFLAIDLQIFMKLVSYSHTMRSIRHVIERIREVDGKKIPLSEFFKESEITPINLNLIKHSASKPASIVNFNHFCYFIAVPTYCFQLSYPRTERIRKVWLLKRIVEFILVLMFGIIVWVQYAEPILYNTYKLFEKDDYKFKILESLERLLKLALPNTYLWITFFYLEFQLKNNILAELFRFADRQFYLDWWNCKNLGDYWKLWNLPVHQWLIRHIYFPMLKKGFLKWQANLIVFLASAVAHEFLVSTSLGLFEIYAFLGMLIQAPVIFIQEWFEKTFKLQNSQLGNVGFWISFCFLGQPLIMFIYYHNYVKKYQTQE